MLTRGLLKRPAPRFRFIAVCALLAGLAVTALAAVAVAKYEREQAEIRLMHRADQAVNTIAARFSLYLAVVQAGQALFAASDEITERDWAAFSGTWRREASRYPGLNSVMFARADEDGSCPVVYASPHPSYPPLVGDDLCRLRAASAAMAAASERGAVSLTGPTTVHDQRTGELHTGVVIFGPVYAVDGGAPDGWVVLPLAIGDVLAGVVPVDAPVSLRVEDIGAGTRAQMYTIGATSVPDPIVYTVTHPAAGRIWAIEVQEPGATFETTKLVATGGVTIALLLAMLLWYAGTMHARAMQLAERMTAAFRESEERYRTIIASLEDAYFEADLAGDLVFFNQALVRLLGYPARELKGMNNRVYMDADNAQKVYGAFNRVFTTGEPERGLEWEVICKGGERRYVEASISLMQDPDGTPTGFRGIARDVTERRRADERIHHLAHYDALTGLPNRTLFEDRMRQVLKRRWEGRARAALLFLDLDRFKTVNDSLGHHTGDELLKLVARRIEDCVRSGDTVCRPGGDEFLVLLAELSDPTAAAHVANKILESVSEPYSVEGWELTVTPSIGVAIIPDDGGDIDMLTRNADTAMYHAKDNGRNNFQFFSPEMNADAEERLSMENGLRRALERDELELHYQPIVDVARDRVECAEALLRWHRPDHGVVAAGDFIDVVEQSGLIVPIGEWVIGEACRQSKAWGVPVAVNLSGLQLRQSSLADTVARILDEHGLDPSQLELEITESVLIEDVHGNVGTVERLHELGVRFSIDDFGTGYSSLSYLKRFPIDHVKIDRSFIRDLVTDPEDAAIINAIIKMAASLQMAPVAEGVETAEQRDYLRRHDCTLMQGYLFGKPMPASEFERLLAG